MTAADNPPQHTGSPSIRAGLRAAVERHVAADAEVQAGGLGDRPTLRRTVARALAVEGVVAPPAEWAALVRGLVDELAGLGPLEELLRDPTVTDVCCNGPAEVWVERAGRLERTPVRFDGDDHLRTVLERVIAPLGVRLDRTHPWVDTVLPGGVRLHAVLPPLADHVTVTLRRVPATVPSWDQLLAWGTLDEACVAILGEVVAARRNLVVCGPAGVGKTTLLARLLAEVAGDRVVVVQDTPELDHPAPHTVHLHTRPATPDGAGGVDTRTLVRNALRMRPDRLVVGEVRGAEVADLLAAMNTGHHGSATTVHANGAADAVTRLVGMALLAGVPVSAAEAQVASAVDVVVAMAREGRGRRVTEVLARAGDATASERLWP